MKKIRSIIESTAAPDPQSLWIDKGELKFKGPNGWSPVVGGSGGDDEGIQKLEEKIDSKVTLVHLQYSKDMTDEMAQSNVKVLQSVEGENYFAEIDGAVGPVIYGDPFNLHDPRDVAYVITPKGRRKIYFIDEDGYIDDATSFDTIPDYPYTLTVKLNSLGEINMTNDIRNNIKVCDTIIVDFDDRVTKRYDVYKKASEYNEYSSDENEKTYLFVICSPYATSMLIVDMHEDTITISDFPHVISSDDIPNIQASSATTETLANKVNSILDALRTANVLSTSKSKSKSRSAFFGSSSSSI